MIDFKENLENGYDSDRLKQLNQDVSNINQKQYMQKWFEEDTILSNLDKIKSINNLIFFGVSFLGDELLLDTLNSKSKNIIIYCFDSNDEKKIKEIKEKYEMKYKNINIIQKKSVDFFDIIKENVESFNVKIN